MLEWRATSYRRLTRIIPVSIAVVGLAATMSACSSDDAQIVSAQTDTPSAQSNGDSGGSGNGDQTAAPTPESDTPEVQGPDNTGIMFVEVGDCLAEDLADAPDRVEKAGIVPCDTPHRSELYHREELSGSSYPGESEVQDQANEICIDQFETFVGLSFESSELNIIPLYPIAEGWDNGDHAVDCYVTAPDDVTGTLRDSRR